MADNPIRYMTVIQYYRDSSPWTSYTVDGPTWNEVEEAIRKMDNFCFPIVKLGCGLPDDDDDSFNIIGGDGRLALFHFMGEWQFEDDSGDKSDVRLWDSDQGYYCKECNVIKDIDLALRVAKQYYETGSYTGLNAIR